MFLQWQFFLATFILLGVCEAPTLTASAQHYQQEHNILTKTNISVLLEVQRVLDQLEKTYFKLSSHSSLILGSSALEAEKVMLLRLGLLILNSLRKTNAWAAHTVLLHLAESSK